MACLSKFRGDGWVFLWLSLELLVSPSSLAELKNHSNHSWSTKNVCCVSDVCWRGVQGKPSCFCEAPSCALQHGSASLFCASSEDTSLGAVCRTYRPSCPIGPWTAWGQEPSPAWNSHKLIIKNNSQMIDARIARTLFKTLVKWKGNNKEG